MDTPNEAIVAEAIKQLRNILGLFVSTCLLWLVAVDAVQNSLQQRDRAKHLAAWLIVRDTFRPHISDLLDTDEKGAIECFSVSVRIQSGTEVDRCDPFVVKSPWHAEGDIRMTLQRFGDGKSAFSVSSAFESLPIKYYAIATVHDGLHVFPRHRAFSERDIHNVVLRDKLAAPEHWPTVRMHLHARGWKGNDPQDLQLNEPNIAAFIRDGFSSSYSVSGIPFSPGLFPAAVSAFLGIMAFLLVGPWLTLRQAQSPPSSDPWVMLVRASGATGLAIRSLQLGVSVLVATLPLFVLRGQFSLAEYMTQPERLVWYPTIVALLVATVMISLCAYRLYRLRRHAVQV